LEKEEPRPVGKVTRPAVRTTNCGMAGRGRPKPLSLTEPLRRGSSKAAECPPLDTSFPNPSRPDQGDQEPDGEGPLSPQPMAGAYQASKRDFPGIQPLDLPDRSVIRAAVEAWKTPGGLLALRHHPGSLSVEFLGTGDWIHG